MFYNSSSSCMTREITVGKKADKWKAKYDELMRITESYIRHLHEANSRLTHYERAASSAAPDPQWGNNWDDDDDWNWCDHTECGANSDRDKGVEAHEMRETETEEIYRLEDEKSNLQYRIDTLECVMRDVLKRIDGIRVLRSTMDGLEPDQRVHLVEAEWDDLVDSARDARESLDEILDGDEL